MEVASVFLSMLCLCFLLGRFSVWNFLVLFEQKSEKMQHVEKFIVFFAPCCPQSLYNVTQSLCVENYKLSYFTCAES